MSKERLEKFKKRFEKAAILTENLEGDYEQIVFDLEEEVRREIEMIEGNVRHSLDNWAITDEETLEEILLKSYQDLLNKIKELKKENDFYDAEVKLDRMFPNKHDDDFGGD